MCFPLSPSWAEARAARSTAIDVQQCLDELCTSGCTDVVLSSVTHLLSPTTHFWQQQKCGKWMGVKDPHPGWDGEARHETARGGEERWEGNAVLLVKRLNNASLQFPRHTPKLNNRTKYDILCQVPTNPVISVFQVSFLSTNCWAENRRQSPYFHVNGFITVSWWHMIYIRLYSVCISGNLRKGRNKVIPLSQIMINKWSRSTLLRKQNSSLQICN